MEDKNLLSGIKVVEVASMVMAPSSAAVLADFGAEVIKIEAPGKGDNNRYLHQLPGQPVSDIAYCFELDNRNKKSVVLDLKQASGLAVLHQLIAEADILITNFRRPALRKLGLDYEQVKTRYPKLIYAYGTGFGERGEEADMVAYDAVSFWARSGIEASMYPAEGWLGPIPAGTGDHVTGMTLVTAIALALFNRERTGQGSKVSTSLLANGIWMNGSIVQARLCGAEFLPLRPRAEAYNALAMSYRCRDGELFKLTVVDEDKNWPGLCRALEQPELQNDPRFFNHEARRRNMSALIAIIENYCLANSLQYLRERLRFEDIPHSPIVSVLDVADDEQLAANDILVAVAGENYRTVSSPFEIDGFKKVQPRRAPRHGEHSRQVMRELGYEDAAIDELFAAGVLH